MVAAYRAARAAYVRERESLSHGHWQAREDEHLTIQPVTFKMWLVSNKIPEEWIM